MATTIDVWLGNSGDWSAPANWSHGVPGAADTASFDAPTAITVTFTATDTIDQLLGSANPGATLELEGGALTLLQGGIWDGVFVLVPSAELAVSGQILTLAGPSELDGVVAGPGTVSVTGFADAERSSFTGSAVLQDLGTIAAIGAITLGTASADAAELTVASGATFAILGDFSIEAAGAATIANAGLFAKTGAGGTSFVSTSLDSTGTITVDRGTLSLDGGNDQLGGTIGGAGELDLRGGGTYELASGLALGVSALGILDTATQVTLGASASYAGTLALGNLARLNLDGHSFTLTGRKDTLDGIVAGPGTMDVQGTADANGLLVAGGAAVVDLGAMTQDGMVNLGTGGADTATLTIAHGGTYDLLGDVSINAFGNAAIGNAGLFEKIGASGTSIIRGSFASAGTLAVDAGTLALEGPAATLAGTLVGAGELDLRGGGNYKLGAGLIDAVATLAVLDLGTTMRLGAGLTDASGFTLGRGASIALAGDTLVLSGKASLAGAIGGPGAASVSGTADVNGLLLSGAAELDDDGHITQDGPLDLGRSATDSAVLTIEQDATYDVVGDDSIVGAGAARIVNAGLFEKTGISGLSTVGAAVSNTGTIAVTRGTLEFADLTNTGVIAVAGSGADAAIVVAAPLVADGAEGAIQIGTGGTVVVQAAVAAGETIAFTGTQGLLELVVPAAVAGTISGFSAGDTIDLIGIAASGLTYTNGGLDISETVNGTLTNVASLQLPGIADPAGLGLLADGWGGTAVAFAPSGGPPGAGIIDNWVAGNGDWSSAANWIEAGGTTSIVPGRANDAVIAPTGTTGFVVSYDTIDTIDRLNSGTVASGAAITLAIGGGALTVTNGGSWSGVLAESAGTFDAVSGFSLVGDLTLGSSAVVEVDNGVFSIGSGTLAGTIRGAGELELAEGGQVTLQPGVSFAVATLDLDDTVSLNQSSLGLSGQAMLDGTVSGPGTVGVVGIAGLDGLVLSGPATLDDGGTIAQDGVVTLGSAASDASVLRIEDGAVYDILADVGILANASAAIDNGGVFEKTGSNGSSVIAADLSNSGTIDVATGLLFLTGGNNTLSGALTGAGALELGPGGNFTLESGLTVTVGTLELGADAGLGSSTTLTGNLSYAGRFALAQLDGGSATLDLNGHSLALSGSALLAGVVDAGSGGTLTLSGAADVNGLVLNGTASLIDTGSVTQEGSLILGNSGSTATTMQIAATGTYDIVADVGIAAAGAATISNAGLLEKIGALGTSTVSGNLDNTGTILAQRDTLIFAGGTVDTLGGTLAGGGEIDFDMTGTATLQNGLALSVASFGLYGGDAVLGGSMTYAGAFTLGSGAILTPNGSTLTLSGTAELGGVQSGGVVAVAGAADANGLALVGSAALEDAGIISQDGMVTLGTAAVDAAGIVIAAGATYDILADVDINSRGNATITNSGLLEKTDVVGTSYVFANLTNTGTIAAVLGTLTLLAGLGTLGGRITGGGEIDLDSSGTYRLLDTSTLDVAAFGLYGGADIILGSSRSYAGSLTLGAGTNLDLNGQALTLTGTESLAGLVQGAGSMKIEGIADANALIVYGGATLESDGVITQDGAVTLGSGADTALLDVGTTGTYEFIADVDLVENGSAIVNNAGLLEKTVGSGASTIESTISNTGTIAATSGALAFTGSLVNDGMIRVADGEVVVKQSLAADSNRTGTIDIASSGEFLLQGAASSAEAIAFTGGAGILALAQPTRIGGTISGLGQADTIDLVGATFTPGTDLVSFAGQVLTITNSGTTIARLNLAGSYGAAEFQLADDGAHGTAITANIPCFLAGTRILTPHGEVRVESLREGDTLLTHSGQARPIMWIGRRRIACNRHPMPHKVQPVRIRAGAFAADMPRRDLLLSPDHALLVDGMLIPVKHLINGITVRQDFAMIADYIHIELETHDVLLAEGLAVESYLDSGNRGEFANVPGPIVLHPSFEATAGQNRYAPLCVSGPALAAVKRALLERLEQAGFTTTTEADLRLVAADRTIRPATVCGNLHRFILPGGTQAVRIASRSGVPAEIEADSEDSRRLGVAIQGIVLDGRLVALEDAALGAGFHDVERSGAVAWRWTDGNADLAISAGRSGKAPQLLELLIRATARSWREPPWQAVRVA